MKSNDEREQKHMKYVLTSTAAALIMGVVTLASGPASAAVVCNRDGECWHAAHAYRYRPAFGLTVHENNWRWGPSEHFTWREHTGRGYWRNGVWVRF